jgi:putative phosphoribosyl transferase
MDSNMNTVFANRAEAGRALVKRLGHYASRDDVVVLGLPRGGVPVAFEIARALPADLDVLIVRKLGVPVQPELAMGAIASGGALYVDRDVVQYMGVTEAEFNVVLARERSELFRREASYRDKRPMFTLEGRVAIVVDDGMATGATVKVAVMALREKKPLRVVAALPVIPADSDARIEEIVDELVCVLRPHNYFGVGQFYLDFHQTEDAEVLELLRQAQTDRDVRKQRNYRHDG